MAWPYKFIDLDDAAKQARRQALDRYGIFAHVSALAVLALFLLYRGGGFLFNKFKSNRTAYDVLPASPGLKWQRQQASGIWAAVGRKVAWWLEEDVRFLGKNWGQRVEFIFGSIWTLWLLFLCVSGTGIGKSICHMHDCEGVR